MKPEKKAGRRAEKTAPPASLQFVSTVYYDDDLYSLDAEDSQDSDFTIVSTTHTTRAMAEKHLHGELIDAIDHRLYRDDWTLTEVSNRNEEYSKRDSQFAPFQESCFRQITHKQYWTENGFPEDGDDDSTPHILQLKDPESLSLSDVLAMEQWLWCHKRRSCVSKIIVGSWTWSWSFLCDFHWTDFLFRLFFSFVSLSHSFDIAHRWRFPILRRLKNVAKIH